MSNYFKQLCKNPIGLVRNERGQGLVEYALILVLIAVVVIAAMQSIGQKTSNVLSVVGTSLNK